MRVAFFPGRFQPFHLGHLNAIEKAMEKFDKLIIGIGSIQEKNTPHNPFSFRERKRMIEKVLKKYKGKYRIIGIPDFPDDEEWTKFCLKKAKFDVVITGNEWTKKCFEGIKEVLEPHWLKPKVYNATKIRRLIKKGKRWEHLVPEEVGKIIKEIGGEERIRGFKDA